MSAILTKGVEDFVDDLKLITIEAYFMSGYVADNMKVVKTIAYQGDILDVSMRIWGDLRVFASKSHEFDSDLQCGLTVMVKGLEGDDPRLSCVRQRIYGYISQFNKQNNPRYS